MIRFGDLAENGGNHWCDERFRFMTDLELVDHAQALKAEMQARTVKILSECQAAVEETARKLDALHDDMA